MSEDPTAPKELTTDDLAQVAGGTANGDIKSIKPVQDEKYTVKLNPSSAAVQQGAWPK